MATAVALHGADEGGELGNFFLLAGIGFLHPARDNHHRHQNQKNRFNHLLH